jgi:uncharacterized membrane protein YoaT (DUF817 family)
MVLIRSKLQCRMDGRTFLHEFWWFGLKQAWACLFAALFFLLLIASHALPVGGMPRYDFLFVSCILLQAALWAARVESTDEVATIAVFHLVGLCLELFKTHPAVGAWSYPEPCFFRAGTVPLYSGFMYASVASYMCRAWRLLKLELEGYPSYAWSLPLAAAIYGNFFSNRFFPDARLALFAAIAFVFRGARVYFTVTATRRSMPLVLSFALIGFFVWIAENFSTYWGAWVYPHQASAWRSVSLRIISSWVLLAIISFILVAELNRLRGHARLRAGHPSPRRDERHQPEHHVLRERFQTREPQKPLERPNRIRDDDHCESVLSLERIQ